ncbi:alpha/beta hydrolase [Rhodoferax saidenbachensis]|uniref:Pimeloyl-ACP methyl ester carboxylesterase n=1 Tax=Rhodoferax saidenbachensis TaxID=1484693 RepID=A0ABU1ZU95_9BURK|nr:alpha/beta hydrolase [Rhodoferax saidenbachensis]MDR7308101.1 pimeloyl-ACP methyl ester carboxylesterase [Rhodoferax saidenbachensis]
MTDTTLVLLPGLMCDVAVWAPQVQALSSHATCHVPHWGPLDSLTAMAEHVLATAPARTFALAGHSMGGRVALEVMRMAPQRVERLALLDTGTPALAAGAAGAKEKAGRMELLALAQSSGMRTMGAQWASGMVHPSVLGTALFEQILDMLERSSPAQFAAQIHALLNRPDAGPVLPTITCPTLVLTGREDLWSPPAQHEAMAQAIAGAQLGIVEQCGHMSTMEQPEAVNAAFVAWLAS